MTLRFSIIVPTLDRREMLQAALASIRAQAWPDSEIIVVDGGSTDGTVEAMGREPDICFIAGPDRGVYDAFNRGIERATGDVVGVLNSDDCYEPGAFSAAAAAFAAVPGAQAVCGTALLVMHDQIIAVFDKEADKSLASPRTTLVASCAPNARFFRRAAMARIGTFSLDYKYVSDRDWLTRWYEAGLATTTSRPDRHLSLPGIEHAELQDIRCAGSDTRRPATRRGGETGFVPSREPVPVGNVFIVEAEGSDARHRGATKNGIGSARGDQGRARRRQGFIGLFVENRYDLVMHDQERRTADGLRARNGSEAAAAAENAPGS